MSFLLPTSQALSGKHARVWLITLCMWFLFLYAHPRSQISYQGDSLTNLHSLKKNKTKTKTWLACRKKRSLLCTCGLMVGVFCIDTVGECVNERESVCVFPTGPPFDEGWVIRKETPRKTGSLVIYTFTQVCVCMWACGCVYASLPYILFLYAIRALIRVHRSVLESPVFVNMFWWVCLCVSCVDVLLWAVFVCLPVEWGESVCA